MDTTKLLLILIASILLFVVGGVSNIAKELWDIKEIVRDIRSQMIFDKKDNEDEEHNEMD